VVRRNLSQTLKSVSAQTHDGWRCVVVANAGADLPTPPANVEFNLVDFSPNPIFEQGRHSRDEYYDAVRWDKGRRVLAGMLQMRESRYFMVVDDDDLVSRNLTRFVAHHLGANGWYVRDGYVWRDGGTMLYRHPDFCNFCGSSLIIRSDLFELPLSIECADPHQVRRMLGSHVFIKRQLADRGVPLEPLPFPGAVYRVGHMGAHSRSRGLLRTFFLRPELLRRPSELPRRISRLRLLTQSVRGEFWG
jgi:hypothetical protein